MAKDAYVLRRFSDAGERKLYPAGAVIVGMDDGRFLNLGKRVREATAEEVAAAGEGNAPAPLDAAPTHPRGLVPPPPPPAPPKRQRKPPAKKAAAKKPAAKGSAAAKSRARPRAK
jgi:hypothetical protein